ncbi:MAG: glycosyltransferase family 4 protein, partial [Planctomycetota bacterium]
MRLLEIETFGRGGLTHYAYSLSWALARRGHEVTLLTGASYELEDLPSPSSPSGQSTKVDEAGSVEVVKLFSRWTWKRGASGVLGSLARKFEAIYDGFALLWRVRRLRPDLVHLHCTNPVAWLYLELLRFCGCPVIATAHVVTPHEPIRFQKTIYRRLHHASALVIAHSEVDRARLLTEFAVPESRTRVIPHGEYSFLGESDTPVDRQAERRALGFDEESEVVLFFGYLREYKGLDLLLEGWPRVAEARPQARLLIVGDPVQLPEGRRQELQTWADRLGAVSRFEFIPLEDIARYFAAADLLAMPYRRISQSGVLFLAISVGVPVVATQVGALPEMLTEGESALLVPPEDSAAFADAVVRVLEDPALRERLAAGGREVAAQHSWESIAERTE